MHIGQAEVAAAVAVRQGLVVDAEPLGIHRIHHLGESRWADWEQFGVVYIALRGNGFACGQPIDNNLGNP
jgi:hypothetical protein